MSDSEDPPWPGWGEMLAQAPDGAPLGIAWASLRNKTKRAASPIISLNEGRSILNYIMVQTRMSNGYP